MKYFLKRILGYIGYKLSPKNSIEMDIRQLRNFIYYNKIFQTITNLQGSVVECGVGKARSFSYLAFLIFSECKNRTLWGFDSFVGFPEPTKEDVSDRNPAKGEWGEVSVLSTLSTLKVLGLPEDFISKQILIKKGFFEDSLGSYDNKDIALLHIDVDLYQSYKICLEKFFPFVKKGGIVMFDEYNSTKWPGAKKAIDEYFGSKIKDIKHDELSGKYFLIKS